MPASLSRVALLVVLLLVPMVALAQQGMPMGKDRMMMCPMCGAGGIVLMVLGGLLVLAATAALVALTLFLLRKSRPRSPTEA